MNVFFHLIFLNKFFYIKYYYAIDISTMLPLQVTMLPLQVTTIICHYMKKYY